MKKLYPTFYLVSIFFVIVGISSCKKKAGCTDKCASNYVKAKTDDGSCEYKAPIINTPSWYIDNCRPPYGVYFWATVSNISCPVKYTWNFGDGTRVEGASPFHIFNTAGTYTVSVTALNGEVESTRQFNISLDTAYNPISDFEFEVENNNYRVPAKIYFENNSKYSGSYEWDFGDGSSSTKTHPDHTFTTPGIHWVSLKAKCSGKEKTISKRFEILPKPTDIAITKFHVGSGSQQMYSSGTLLYVEAKYNGNTRFFSKSSLFKSYPAVWYFPSDIANGNYKISDNFLQTDRFEFNLWRDDLGLNDFIINSSYFDFDYLQDNYYPNIVELGGNDYQIWVYLDYY